MHTLELKLKDFLNAAILYAPKAILAVLMLVIGLWIIKLIVRAVDTKILGKTIDPTIHRFVVSLIDVMLKVMLILSVASTLGLETTSFLAILTSASLAIGLALQGGLANFAGGVLILIFKPFKVGDKINAQGFVGDVTEISIFVTKLITDDQKTIIIPNGPLANGSITNLSEQGKLRVDIKFNVTRQQDLAQTREIIIQALLNTEGVLSDPPPTVGVIELGDGWTKLVAMPFCLPKNFDNVFQLGQENIRYALNVAEIEHPIPQQIHFKKKEGRTNKEEGKKEVE